MRIFGAAPERFVGTTIGSLDHRCATGRAIRCGRGWRGRFGSRSDRGRCRRLHVADQREQRVAVDQLDGLALCEALRIRRKGSDRNDLDGARVVVRQQPVHLPHDLHVHTLAAPLFALDEGGLAVLGQAQVDATVRTAQARFLDSIALAAKRLANQHFELLPTHRAQAVEARLGFQQAAALTTGDEGGEGGKATDSEPRPRDRPERSAARRSAYRCEGRATFGREIPPDSVANGYVADDAEHDANRPRH